MPRSKVELYAAIRRDGRAGLSQRAVMARYGVGRSTVLAAEASAWPAQRRVTDPRASKLDPYKPTIDRWLTADLDAPRKQRHTAKRIFDRLVAEHAMAGVSYPVVRRYVSARRSQILADAGRGPALVFVPQSHRPGAEAEVDFGDVSVRLGGQLVTCALFAFRMSYSGRAVHRVFITAGQEAFFEGHVYALGVLGGVPFAQVRYDNLKAAVAQVLGFARARVENQRWVAFRSHYGLEAFYCQPGIDGAHEKGGVEGDIGRFRRNHFVPVPDVASIDELNELVAQWDAEDDRRRIGARAHTVEQMFAAEANFLKPLPGEVFETGLWLHPRVDRYAQVTVRTNRYSVPVRLIGRQVRVLLHASHLVVYDGQVEVARHERLPGKSGTRLELDHYLEALARKPGALPGATALDQARQAGKFTPTHDAWWSAVVKAHGDTEGTRALIEVLLLHRHLRDEHVVAGLTAALHVGALTADAVALEARKAADHAGIDDVAAGSRASVTTPARVDDTPGPVDPDRVSPSISSLTRRRLAKLPPDTRPLPSVAVYDSLLRLPRISHPSVAPDDRSTP